MTPIEQSLMNALVGTITCTGESAEACYHLPEDFEGFNGHFPGHPILPAILQFMLGRLVCSALAGESLRVTSISRAKFSHEIQPEVDIYVQAVRKDISAENIHRFSVTLTVGTAQASTFSLFCVAEQEHA
ncbi:hypothetical protein ACQ0P8_03480 [Halodesulfovibrio aestuarii]|uniref:3-hydroxyacyl-[acyl-carrier-protein] dehydratase n=1 Tax=Halodesulfovibrio aestuarii TaxID=126333 RepID=A0A8G2C7U0_9BACT|nr:hypothetical protein [Halodesulfovibrio aestuarii]SHI70659.1 3-hydroxyacyl-[acyl-carrier-protein] dehydratase [Halodesulfovibrio aestuarii]